MAYFSSDRTTTYLASDKPFVDAVNADTSGLIHIDVGVSGVSARIRTEQLRLVLKGAVDFAFVVPGYTPAHFPDNTVIELPGLFADVHEATLVYTGLIAANELRGYDELFVVGAFATEPETIYTRPPAGSLDET